MIKDYSPPTRCNTCEAKFTPAKRESGCPVCGNNTNNRWIGWVAVRSSHLSKVRWVPFWGLEEGYLEVEFRSGGIYRYPGNGLEPRVPKWVFEDLIDPSLKISKGKYFKQKIKGDKFSFEKIGDV